MCKCTRSGRDVQGRYISLDLRPASSKSNEKDYGGLNESHLFPNVMDELEVTVRLDWTDIIDGLAAFRKNELCLFFIFAHQGRGKRVASRQNDLALL